MIAEAMCPICGATVSELRPFDPFALSQLWFTAWRGHIRNAKAEPDKAGGYCQAAAYAAHLMEQALEIVRSSK